MELKPRYYQKDYVRYTYDYINKGGRRGIAALPTGLGKSVCIAMLFDQLLKARNHLKVLNTSHRKELIIQNAAKLRTLWPTAPIGIYSAGMNKKQYSYPIVYGGIQSMWRKPHIFGKTDLLVIDEVQTVSEKDESMYGNLINGLLEINPDMVVLGLTATPYRMGMGLLTEGPIFDDVYYDVTTMDDFVRFIDEGYLCDLISVRTETNIDLSSVKMTKGDFQEKSLDENVNRDEITKAIVLETMRRTQDRNKGIGFCVSIAHAENMASRFNEMGYPCTVVHSKLDGGERDKRIESFRKGDYKVLTSVSTLLEGFDVPDIDFIVMARPTQSTGLHVQSLGRGLRPHPSKDNTLVLDFAGNTERLGPINDPIMPMAKGDGVGEAPVRVCDHCGVINHASVRICKQCGTEFPPPKVNISETLSDIQIIKRSDVPLIDEYRVKDVIVNKHISSKGNVTAKLTFVCETGEFVDQYLIFDKRYRQGFIDSIRILDKLEFEKPYKQMETYDEQVLFIKENLIPPTSIRVWKNKIVRGRKSKRKVIMSFKYE